MIRRGAALLGLVSFALAWIVGALCGRSPLPRMESALLALVLGAAAGAGIAIALQKIVLARLAEQWREDAGKRAAAGAAAPAPDDAAAAKPAPARARRAAAEVRP